MNDSELLVGGSHRFEECQLYRIDPERGEVVQLTNEGYYFTASWSPDRTRIVASWARSRRKRPELIFLDRDGRRTDTEVARGRTALYPDWSPDGARIAYSEYSERDQALMTVGMDGTTPAVLAPWGTFPDWSPDGARIVYTVHEGDVRQIWFVDVESGKRTRLTDWTSGASWPRWSPDGERIAFNRDATIGSTWPDLSVMNADGSGQTKLIEGAGNAAWSPDGRRLAYLVAPPNTPVEEGGSLLLELASADGSNRGRLDLGGMGVMFVEWR